MWENDQLMFCPFDKNCSYVTDKNKGAFAGTDYSGKNTFRYRPKFWILFGVLDGETHPSHLILAKTLNPYMISKGKLILHPVDPAVCDP